MFGNAGPATGATWTVVPARLALSRRGSARPRLSLPRPRAVPARSLQRCRRLPARQTASAAVTVLPPPRMRVTRVRYLTVGSVHRVSVSVADGVGRPVRGAAVTAALYRNGGRYALLRGIMGRRGERCPRGRLERRARASHDAGAPGGRGSLRLVSRHAGEPLLQAQVAATAASGVTRIEVADLRSHRRAAFDNCGRSCSTPTSILSTTTKRQRAASPEACTVAPSVSGLLGGLGFDALGLFSGERGACGDAPLGDDVPHFRSRPDLRPPRLRSSRAGVRSGLFLCPRRGGPRGALILGGEGDVVWFRPTSLTRSMNFRTARYKGEPVLTWWEGRAASWARPSVRTHRRRDLSRYRAVAGRSRPAVRPARAPAHSARHRDRDQSRGPDHGPIIRRRPGERQGGRQLSSRRSRSPAPGPLRVAQPRARRDRRVVSSRYTGTVRRLPHQLGRHRRGRAPTSSPPATRGASTRCTVRPARCSGAWREAVDFQMGPGTRFAWQHDARHHEEGRLITSSTIARRPGWTAVARARDRTRSPTQSCEAHTSYAHPEAARAVHGQRASAAERERRR